MNRFYRNFLLLLTIKFFFVTHILNAAWRAENWHSITNKSGIEDIAGYSNLLIAATKGGVLLFDQSSEKFIGSYSNTEGLSNNHPICVVIDTYQNWWFGMNNGDINYFDQNKKSCQVFSDYKNFTIHDMSIKGDSLFLALDIGVSVFLMNKKEAKETYKKLGVFPVEVEAFNICIQGNVVWVGTKYGIATANLNQNLKAPQSWTNIVLTDGLKSNNIKAIFYFQNSYFIGTDAGIQRYKDNQWINYSDFPSSQSVHFFNHKTDLFVSLRNSIYRYDPGSDSWSLYCELPYAITSFFVNENNIFWIGTEKNGIIRWDSFNGQANYFLPDGPGGNNFLDLAIDQRSNLWCVSGDLFGNGVYQFNGENWKNYSLENQDIPSNNTVSVAVDLNNNVWIGSWGKGVFQFSSNDIYVYNVENGYLSGIPSDLNYAVVNNLAVDQLGTIWMTNYAAYNNNKLIAVTIDLQWIYFGTVDGILSANPSCMTIDQNNWKWVGTISDGVYVYDDNYSPANKSDDRIVQSIDQSNGLESNVITALAADDNNTIWIGTTKGLNYYQDGRVFSTYGLISNEINCISIDPIGNIWVGTSIGFSILDHDNLNWINFSPDNSQLVNENVLSITFDRKKGLAFIGTSNGLSIIEINLTEPEKLLSQLSIHPNPLYISLGNLSNLFINNLSYGCSVNVYSTSGNLIRRLDSNSKSGRIIWDGRNDQNEIVASGIYLITATQTNGTSTSAKVAIVRQ